MGQFLWIGPRIERLENRQLLSATDPAAGLGALPAAAVECRDYYVNDDVAEGAFAAGDDANDGLSAATPMRTIQEVLDRHDDIATIHVSVGIYHERIWIGSTDPGVRLVGAGPGQTILDGDRGGRVVQLLSVPNVTVEGLTIRNGWADNGGGVNISSSSVEFLRCEIRENGVTRYGGGVWIDNDATATFADCTFFANRSDWRGGGLAVMNTSDVVVERCSFLGNDSSILGGGLYANTRVGLVVRSSVFVGNSTGAEGGAICRYGAGPLLLDGCTIVDNVCSRWAGGVFLETSSEAISLRNTIVRSNSGMYARQMYVAAEPTPLDIAWCNVEGGWAGEDNIDAAPQFAAAPDDGGDGWGEGDNDDYGDLHLTLTSPCIDAGDPADPAGGLQDFDGLDRKLYAARDIGAHEYRLDGDANLDGAVGLADLGILAGNYGLAGDWSQGDFRDDGLVSLEDLAILAGNYGVQMTASPAPTPASDLALDTAAVALDEAAVPAASPAVLTPVPLEVDLLSAVAVVTELSSPPRETEGAPQVGPSAGSLHGVSAGMAMEWDVRKHAGLTDPDRWALLDRVM